MVRALLGTSMPLVLTELPLGGQGWTVTHAIFACAGLSAAATQKLAAHQGLAIDLHRLMHNKQLVLRVGHRVARRFKGSDGQRR